MTQLVVDVLEMIEVDQQHRHGCTVFAFAADPIVEILCQTRTVGQTGQHVSMGGGAKLRFQLITLSNILEDADQRDRFTFDHFPLAYGANPLEHALRITEIEFQIVRRAVRDTFLDCLSNARTIMSGEKVQTALQMLFGGILDSVDRSGLPRPEQFL